MHRAGLAWGLDSTGLVGATQLDRTPIKFSDGQTGPCSHGALLTFAKKKTVSSFLEWSGRGLDVSVWLDWLDWLDLDLGFVFRCTLSYLYCTVQRRCKAG